MDDLLQEFIAETRETLEALSGEIVAWEANPTDRSRLDSIFRFVHTVKGSCGFVDLPRLARLSHAAEDVLAAVRSGERVPDTALVNAVLAIVDRIGEIVEAIDAGVALDDSSEDLLIAALEKDAAAATVVHGSAAQRTPTRSVRLSVDLLDRMMSGMSDMVLARNELARTMRDDAMLPQVEAALERLSATVAEMRDTVTRTRMQRIDALFSAVPRLVRDTAAATGKAVNLKIDGADVELDREMIEMMRDPLVHMIRNAIDHGIEPPEQRRAAGKRETGQLTLSARQSGNRILIDIADDGRGIDVARLVAKAVAQAPHREAELATATERAKLDLIFEAGLSANDTVTSVSGRGVGMDVVRANIEQIGGRIILNNRPGHGLTVAIQVPLTLSILPAVTVTVGKDRFAIPRQAIEEIVSLAGTQTLRIDEIGGARVLTLRERRLPFVDLATLMGTRFIGDEPQMAMIVDVPDGAFALGIDAVHDTEELVVKPAAPAVMAAGFYAGQTLPDSGLPMLLLDCAGVAARAGLRFDRVGATDGADLAQAEAEIPALLFDDLDGVRRAIVLAAIDRIEQVPAHMIRASGGRLRLTVEDRAIPLLASAAVPPGATCAVLRLHDEDVELGYVIAEAINIVTLPAALAPAVGTGLVAGVAVIDGEPVELLDPLRLYAAAAETGAAASASAPVCLLQGSDTAWMEAFLKPVVEAAGYRVATRLTDGSVPTVVLAMEDDALVPRAGVPTVRLSRTRGQGLHRLDRTGLLDALKDPARLESAA